MINKKSEEFDKIITLLQSKKSISVKLDEETIKNLIRMLTLSKETIEKVNKTGLDDSMQIYLSAKEYGTKVDTFIEQIVKLIEDKCITK